MKRLTVNGRDFEVIKPRTQISDEYVKKCAGKDLLSVYDRPSYSKQSIYTDWLRWAMEDDKISFFGVTRGNTYKFTLVFIYTDGEDKYVGSITDCHNKLYKL